jgi:predicted nucleic acid-binding protein
VTRNSAAIIDSAAIVEAIAGAQPESALLERVDSAAELHAPHVVDVEFANALHGLVRGGELTTARAAEALEDFVDAPILRYPHVLLLGRIWALRDRLSAYDAAFVALSEALELPLITTDARLARAADGLVEVERF